MPYFAHEGATHPVHRFRQQGGTFVFSLLMVCAAALPVAVDSTVHASEVLLRMLERSSVLHSVFGLCSLLSFLVSLVANMVNGTQ